MFKIQLEVEIDLIDRENSQNPNYSHLCLSRQPTPFSPLALDIQARLRRHTISIRPLNMALPISLLTLLLSPNLVLSSWGSGNSSRSMGQSMSNFSVCLRISNVGADD